MNKLNIFLILLFMTCPFMVHATVDYFAVNHITKEYYWGDEDNSTGWIGWESVSESELGIAEEKFSGLGYERTYYPYKIETLILFIIFLLFSGFFVIRNKKMSREFHKQKNNKKAASL